MNANGTFPRLSTALVVVLVIAAIFPASAQSPERGGSGPSGEEPTGQDRVSGATAMVASAVYPGLGQLLNRAEPKSAILSAVEVALVAGLVVEDRRTRNAFRLYLETGDSDYYDEYSRHYDRRQTLVWWVAIAALYGLTDAYVDAHLADFDSMQEIGPGWTLETDGGGGIRFGLAFRY